MKYIIAVKNTWQGTMFFKGMREVWDGTESPSMTLYPNEAKQFDSAEEAEEAAKAFGKDGFVDTYVDPKSVKFDPEA